MLIHKKHSITPDQAQTVLRNLRLLDMYIEGKLAGIQPLTESPKNIEYVIWGIPSGKTDEELLMTKFEGQPINDPTVAEKLANILTSKYSITDIRIQKVDLNDDDIAGAFMKGIK